MYGDFIYRCVQRDRSGGQLLRCNCRVSQSVFRVDSRAVTDQLNRLLCINIAAEVAAARPDVKGPNTFRAALIDEIYNITPNVLRSRARIAIV